ncbi:MAG: glycoside hydrolase family 43 protein [Nibricoccus sp.]
MSFFSRTAFAIAVAVAAFAAVSVFAGDEAGAWVNPIVPQRADPHVILHSDGYYYLTATVPEYDRIEIRRARTLAGLAGAVPKTVWKRLPSGPMSGVIWAPELHFIGGSWYVYFSAGNVAKNWEAIRPCVIENAAANPLEGEWTMKGRIVTKWDTFALDGTTFEHRGVRYFVWAQVEPGKTGTNILIARMDSPVSLVGEEVVLSRPELPWEQKVFHVNEAPAALVKNGKVFLAYSASATDHHYCMGLLTAPADADLLDPKSWTKSADPVFQSDDNTSQYGPGHNSFTTTPDGKTDILVYHARNFKEIAGGNALANPDRATRAQEIRWKADGTPDFGRPVADGPYRISNP